MTIRIIDAGVHILETADSVAPYCDMPWRRVLEDGKAPPFTNAVPHPLTAPKDFTLRVRGRLTRSQLLAELDALGISVALLLPDVFQRIGFLPTIDYALALASAYNRWQTESLLTERNRFAGAIIVAPQDPEESAREIERYGREVNVAAVLLPVAGVDPLWGHRRYDPFYAAAVAQDLPVIFHGGGNLTLPLFSGEPPQFDTWFQRKTLSQPLLLMANLVNILGTGVPARFPELRLVFGGAGVTWASHMIQRLDKEYSENRRDVPWLEDRPSAYFRRQMALLTHPIDLPADKEQIDTFLTCSGYGDNLIYASGFPYHDFDAPSRVLNLPLPPQAKSEILVETAARFLPKLTQLDDTGA
jgi:hypothetical protein